MLIIYNHEPFIAKGLESTLAQLNNFKLISSLVARRFLDATQEHAELGG
jgi:hypothetical protein